MAGEPVQARPRRRSGCDGRLELGLGADSVTLYDGDAESFVPVIADLAR